MKFTVKGSITGQGTFTKEVEAKSKKHAKDMVFAFFGSKHGIGRQKISVSSAEKANK